MRGFAAVAAGPCRCRREIGRRRASLAALSLLVFFFALPAAPALAIPTPDVLVNVFTGLGQTLVVAGGALAGLVASVVRRRRAGGASSRSSVFAPAALAALAASLLFNAYQCREAEVERTNRLSRNLVRSSKQDGQIVLDVSLKEMPMSEQVKHPLGVTTDEVEELLREHPETFRLDVRETEEYVMGRIEGAVHMRFPDAMEDPSILAGRDRVPILFCYSGNRSGELAQEFARRGIDCRFMIGGYEKWYQEKRPLAENRLVEGPRDIEDYPGKNVLLDTAEVEALAAEGDVVFIDPRYPGDFAAGHLPGAINIPLRKLLTDEIPAYLDRVPKGKRLVGVAYDKRSSFYSLLLGSKLSKLGHEWLGRYTLPHEYMPPKPVPPVDAEPGPLTAALFAALAFLDARTGSAAAAILLLVVLIRLALLPVTVLAERSESAARRARGEVESLRTRVAAVALFRKERAKLLRARGVRPGYALAAGLLQIAAFVVLADALAGAKPIEGRPALFVVPDLSKPDPTGLLSAAIAILASAQMLLTGKFQGRRGLAAVLFLGALFFAITLPLAAALDLAVAANVAISVLHVGVFRAIEARAARPRGKNGRLRPAPPSGIVPLFGAHLYGGVGPKAARLSVLNEEGLPVPDGFVLTEAFFGREPNSAASRRDLLRAFDRLGRKRVAVRSAAMAEDGASRSFAGVFESILNVERDGLEAAIAGVAASFRSERAADYAGADDVVPCVLVQEMVPATCAGVAFTRHPSHPEEVLVEAVDGLGESLVSGRCEPRRASFGRRSRRVVEGEPAWGFEPARLVELALECERVFDGRAQDIEWACADGALYVLQSRDVTADALARDGDAAILERERRRLLERLDGARAGSTPLRREAFAELLPFPTESSLSLLERLLGPGGPAEAARRKFALPYAAEEARGALVTAFGRLYVDRPALERLFPEPRGAARVLALRTAIRCVRARETAAREWRETTGPRLEREIRVEKCRDLARLSAEDLGAVLESRLDAFLSRHAAAAEEINVVTAYQAAEFGARREADASKPVGLVGAAGVDSVTGRGEALLRDVAFGRRPLSDYLAEYGHRALCDYELAAPRFSEDPTPVLEMARALATGGEGTRAAEPRGEATDDDDARRRLEELCALKETSRHHIVRWIALLREAIREIGVRRGLGDTVFHLSIDEALALARGERQSELSSLAAARAREFAAFRGFAAADAEAELGIVEIERLGRSSAAPHGTPGALRGTCVSGGEPATGRVVVLRPGGRLDGFEPGDILVAPFTESSLAPLFRRAGGLVTEVGGVLSHAAIVAREMGLLAIVGVRGAIRELKTGDLVRLELDGSIRVLGSERRRHSRVERELPVLFRRGGDWALSGRSINVSESGALVDAEIAIGAPGGGPLEVKLDGLASVRASVVRSETQGGRTLTALAFESPAPDLKPR